VPENRHETAKLHDIDPDHIHAETPQYIARLHEINDQAFSENYRQVISPFETKRRTKCHRGEQKGVLDDVPHRLEVSFSPPITTWESLGFCPVWIITTPHIKP
jgi:hypothetical protein